MHRVNLSCLASLACLLGLATPASAQQTPIHGQDAESAGRGQGPTGWVQAPVPRGFNAPIYDGQGHGAGQAGANREGGQVPPGQNPGAPVASSLPNPSGIAPGSPSQPGSTSQ